MVDNHGTIGFGYISSITETILTNSIKAFAKTSFIKVNCIRKVIIM